MLKGLFVDGVVMVENTVIKYQTHKKKKGQS